MGVGKKVGFAVVGLGTIAQGFVLPSFARSKNAKLVAVVSRDKDKAARVARKFKAGARTTATMNTRSALRILKCPQPLWRRRMACMNLSPCRPRRPANTCCARNLWRLPQSRLREWWKLAGKIACC